MKRKTLITSILVLLVLSAASFWGWRKLTPSTATAAVAVQTATVTRGSLVATVSAAGNVSAPATVALAFQNSGRVSQVNVQVGDVVKKGQTLMQLDTANLQSSLKTAQLSLAEAQASYDSAKITYDQNPNQLIVAKAALNKATVALQQAQANYDTIAWRGDVGMTSQAVTLQQATDDYQSALATYNITAASINDAALKQAQAKLDEAKIAVDDAQRNLDQATLVAPFDGIVAAVNYNVSDTASGTAVTIVDLSPLQVAVTVSEVDIAKIQVGETATMTLDALSGKSYNAKVISISPVGTITSGVVNYTVTLAITNADDTIKPGMTANLAVEVQRRDNVLLVPVRAVRTQGNQKVVTMRSNGQSIQKAVSTGLSNDTSIEITSGLQEGDVVLINQTTTSTSTVSAGGIGILGVSGGPSGPPPN